MGCSVRGQLAARAEHSLAKSLGMRYNTEGGDHNDLLAYWKGPEANIVEDGSIIALIGIMAPVLRPMRSNLGRVRKWPTYSRYGIIEWLAKSTSPSSTFLYILVSQSPHEC